MWEWLSAASSRASRSNRATRSALPAISGGQDLDGDIAAEPGIVGAIDLTHAATPQQRHHREAADVTSPQVSHCRDSILITLGAVSKGRR